MELENVLSKYEPVIGIEIHAQLKTNTKAYCSDKNEFGATPNTLTSPISLGHPGTLPKFNKELVNHAVKLGLALDCDITREMHFDRKNYFYADLPKGYQITQDKTPICEGGNIKIKLKNGSEKPIDITRIHMEEDSGKSIHDLDPFNTLIDLNRAGVPLLEIVTEPVIKSSEEAYQYVTEIRKLLRYLDICDGNMEEGSMRCDVNISIMPIGSKEFGQRVEIKNLNSIRNVQRSIDFEMVRHAELLEKKCAIHPETRTFDAPSGTTIGMRTKEAAHDYRYFPEPDLNPLSLSDEFIEKMKSIMPALPNELFKKYTKKYGLSDYDANNLTELKEIANYFENIIEYTNNYKAATNWIMGSIKSTLNQQAISIDEFQIPPKFIAELIEMIDKNQITHSLANQKLFGEMILNPSTEPLVLAKNNNWIRESENEDELEAIVKKILTSNPAETDRFKNGEKKLIGFFMGQIMKATKGTANPKIISQLLNQIIKDF